MTTYTSLKNSIKYPQLTPIQSQLSVLLIKIKQKIIQNNIVNTEQQIQSILSQSTQNQEQDLFYVSNIQNVVNYLIASIIEQRQHSQQLMRSSNQNTQNNDRQIVQGLQIFVDLTQKMAQFSKQISRESQSDNNQLPVQIIKHFRQVYELAQQLSGVFNNYNLSNQQFLLKRDQLITMQIKYMQDVFLDQQLQRELVHQRQDYRSRLLKLPQDKVPSPELQTEQYVFSLRQQVYHSLRQQVSHLHQTLIKNDQQFTFEIQVTLFDNRKNYNRTLREMSSTIKAYQIELAKITTYQLQMGDLQSIVIRLRQEKYSNQIVIENMAKKIRNYQREIKGDRSFLSPSRQRLVSPPESRFSMLNFKVGNSLSMVTSVNHNLLLSPTRKSLF